LSGTEKNNYIVDVGINFSGWVWTGWDEVAFNDNGDDKSPNIEGCVLGNGGLIEAYPFNDFKNYDRHTTCMPILVCEGAKDALMLKRIYPYTLAVGTARLGISAHILSNITDKIILAYDNDETGSQSTPWDRKTLTNLGCSVDVLKYHDGFKDASDYVDHPEEYEELKQQLKLRVKGLLTGCTLV
jgi:hypothetical protein